MYLHHPRIQTPIIYDERYEAQGWVPFSQGWEMTSSIGIPRHTLDLTAYKSFTANVRHFSEKSMRQNIYYKIPFKEFTLSSKAY